MRMRLNGVSRVMWLAAAAMAVTVLGCAQQVGDIDRTEPNALLKSDFTDGEWYIRQTFSDVPPAAFAGFVGLTSTMEKVRWEITQDYLIAYRSYEQNPGAARGDMQPGENGEPVWADGMAEGYGTEYHESAVAAYPIISHFDVQRQYNSSTGEQSNVIVENSSDRHWNERTYFRVDWNNQLTSNTLFDNYFTAGLSFYVEPSEESTDALVLERWGVDAEGEEYTPNIPGIDADDYAAGELYYLDFTNRLVLDPGYSYCFGYYYPYGLDDCAASEVEIRTSMLRVPGVSDYEPIFYDESDQAKFGYFRNDRLTYDQRYGERLSNQILLANRHNIWSDTWQRNADGSIMRDGEGRVVPRPMADRTPRPIVYHTSQNYPEGLWDDTVQIADDFDRAFRRAVAAAQGTSLEATPRMFHVCHNPVTQEDPAECGDVGLVPRVGDLRYNFIYWVANPQQSGPAGYGPSNPDPETGEIIAGQAFIYGEVIDTVAQYGVDLVRFLNGDLDFEDLQDSQYIREDLLRRVDPNIDPRGMLDARVNDVRVEDLDIREMLPDSALALVDYVDEFGLNDFVARPEVAQQRFDLIEESGLGAMAVDDELLRGFGVTDMSQIPEEVREARFEGHILVPRSERENRERHLAQARNAICFEDDNLEDTVAGLALHYRGRTDYDNIWEELRGLYYRGVQSHEVGHTVGLRHNFSGTYDSLNFADEFWRLKTAGVLGVTEEGSVGVVPFRIPQYLNDIYGMTMTTPAQVEGRMREYQYSTVMDYGWSFNSDVHGIGRYDEAAIIFGYTAGRDATVRDYEPNHPLYNTQERGYVETFNNTGSARQLFEIFEGLDSPAYPELLEKLHYSTVAQALASDDTSCEYGNPDSACDWESESYVPSGNLIQQRLRERGLIRYDALVDQRDQGNPNRPIEVPYMFLSDEWRGYAQSARAWDQGADPLEQARTTIERYRTYYPFEYFRRDRTMWFQSDLFDRLQARYFGDLVDNYQRWLFDVLFSGTFDNTLYNAWTFASFASLNLLAEVMTTPSYGSYELDEEDNVYYLVDYEQNPDAELYVPQGVGRRPFSRYDANYGYNYDFFPTEAGQFWGYLAAIFSMSSASSVGVRGQDVDADFLSYSIPPYLVFEEEMTRLYNGLWLEDNSSIAPVTAEDGGQLQLERRLFAPVTLTNGGYIDPETGFQTGALMDSSLDANVGPTIDVMWGFSYRYYALLFGMAFFDTNYSTHFADQNRVFRLGGGESLTPAPGFDVAQFCDPFSLGGVCYAALSRTDENDPSAAVRLVTGTQELYDEYLCLDTDGADCALVDVDSDDVANEMGSRESQITNNIEYMNMMRGMYDVFGNSVN